MAKKVKFNETQVLDKLFMQLSAEEATEGQSCPFRDWELLHELDGQQRRKDYAKSPERLARRREIHEETLKVRAYIAEHPEVEKALKDKVKI